MIVAGAGLGLAAGAAIGPVAGYFGFAALVALGAYTIRASRAERSEASKFDLSHGWGLAVASLSISLDSLGIGFSILYIGAALVESLAIIGVVSIGATTLGLIVGQRVGARAERNAALLSGVLLVLTGLTFILLKAASTG
jgi:manganese efflux pump family protein